MNKERPIPPQALVNAWNDLVTGYNVSASQLVFNHPNNRWLGWLYEDGEVYAFWFYVGFGGIFEAWQDLG